ncbi:Asp23/Gls24 family envelope stress response protein [Luedemannella flava]
MADSVVAKIAGLAARSIPGVQSMGTGMARRMGQIKSLVPGSGGPASTATQGVAVEVGERQAAIDLDIVTWYGQSIVDVSEAVRQAVSGQVEGMTGLEVVEVNITVDDIYVESEDDQQSQRVQ